MTMKEFLAKWGTATASLLLERAAAQCPGSTQAAGLRELSLDLENLLKAASTPKLDMKAVHKSYRGCD